MSFINFSNIKAYVESKINVINTLTNIEASQVAVNAFQLARIGYAPSNLSALETYLSNKEAAVSTTDELKYITQLLGSSAPTKSVVWRMQEFLADGTFTVPNNIAGGVVYVTGSGGGASGGASGASGGSVNSESGNSGCYIYRQPVNATAGAVISVVVGAGGAASVANIPTGGNASAAANPGQASVFGTLTIPGGDALPLGGGGWRSGYFSTPRVLAENSIAYKAGSTQQSGNALAFGSAAGAYGNGCDGAAASGSSVTATSGAANSGAAGGSVSVINNTAGSLTATSGAGGSGRVIVEWQEFV
jgi:hypothetical protein